MPTKSHYLAALLCLASMACQPRGKSRSNLANNSTNAAIYLLKDSSGGDAFRMLVSLEKDATGVGVCVFENEQGTCEEKTPGFKKTSDLAPTTVQDRKIFTFKDNFSFVNGKKYFLHILKVDANGKLGLVRKVVLAPKDANNGTGTSQFLPTFVTLKKQRDENTTVHLPILNDILTHLPTSYGNTYYDSDQITWGHETTHGINSHLRTSMASAQGKGNGFYVLDGRGIILREPNIRKSQAAEFIPQSLRNLDMTNRFDNYVTGASDWEDTPSYIFDEWTAYINGSAVAEDILRVTGTGVRKDALNGGLEFCIYAIGVAMAAQKYDPQYFASETQFKNFIGFNLERYLKVYLNNRSHQQLINDQHPAYWQKIQSSSDVEPMRNFVRTTFGTEWANKFLFTP